jgi:hypothetical protein
MLAISSFLAAKATFRMSLYFMNRLLVHNTHKNIRINSLSFYKPNAVFLSSLAFSIPEDITVTCSLSKKILGRNTQRHHSKSIIVNALLRVCPISPFEIVKGFFVHRFKHSISLNISREIQIPGLFPTLHFQPRLVAQI